MNSITHLTARLWLHSTEPRKPGTWSPWVSLAMQVAILLSLWLLASGSAFAFAASGKDPWADSLKGLQETLNGNVARGIGTIALFAAGGMLVFGGELNEFTKKILMVVLAVAVMVLGSNLIGALFPA